MNDRFENIRKALAMGAEREYMNTCTCPAKDMPFGRCCNARGNPPDAANAALIAACDPDTIRALLAERDALAAALEAAREEVERLNRILGRIVEGDGDSTLTIRAGTDAFAAAREYLRPNT